MSALDFEPDKFINCELEHHLFSGLLSFTDDARILAIQGPSGTGKSYLLRSFAHKCRTKNPRIPVCLISLDQPGDAVLPLIQEMVRQLGSFDLKFPTFKHYDGARIDHDFTPFRAYQSTVNLEYASFEGANDIKISGTMVNSEYVERISISSDRVEFTNEQVDFAQEVIIDAFFDDLRRHCIDRPVVILLDVYEKSRQQVRTWINEHFMERLFFDSKQRPAKLVTVIAGQEQPPFRQLWSLDLCETVVRRVYGLSTWERQHIEELNEIYDLALDSASIDAFHHTVRTMHLTAAVIINMIQTSRLKSRRVI